MNKYNNVLYVGITNSLSKRLNQHKFFSNKGFTYKYNIHKLVYYELHRNPYIAISREKLIKRWKRKWKENIIREMNPEMIDLSKELPLTY